MAINVSHGSIRTPDREILENVIIPYLDKGNVCIVGLGWPAMHYGDLFANANVLIIDQEQRNVPNIDFKQMKLQNLHMLFAGHFDAIVANCIAGAGTSYGTTTKEEITLCFEAAYKAMAPQGVFVWGWNDNKNKIIDPIFIDNKFDKMIFEPLESWRYATIHAYDDTRQYDYNWDQIKKMNHTFDFYTK